MGEFKRVCKNQWMEIKEAGKIYMESERDSKGTGNTEAKGQGVGINVLMEE